MRNIFLGKRVSFEFYKSFKDKKDLLDEALLFADGDAILAVRLHGKFSFFNGVAEQMLFSPT